MRLLTVLFLIIFIAAPLAAGEKADIESRLGPPVEHGALVLERDGVLLLSRNLDQPLVPASILKIATAHAALEILGPDFSFKTFFYITPENDLLIKGTGDPFLISEEVAVVGKALKKRGVNRVRNILIDDSFFALFSPASGAGQSDNPYDATNSALAVNFNTVAVSKSSENEVRSAEPQTPDLPLMKELAASLPNGIHRINVNAHDMSGRSMSRRYAGELFCALLRNEGMVVDGDIGPARAEVGGKPVLVHESRPLVEMISPLMRYSNNFIANQFFLIMGAVRYGEPATWDKGRRAVNGFFQGELGFRPDSFYMEEGSGLSRKNRVTARTMLALLAAFQPHARLLPEEDGRRLKSGTMAGVFSYAGYLERKKRLDRVVIILNQEKNTRDVLLGILETF